MKFILIKSVVSVFSSVTPTNYQMNENFGQNLTEAINNALQDQNNSNYKTVIKEALNWSSLVYYETGNQICALINTSRSAISHGKLLL